MPTLVESNITNKPMGPKSLCSDYHYVTVCLIRPPNLQIYHKGKGSTHSLKRSRIVFVYSL